MEQNEMNSQKAQELTKEELEQVNGGSGPSIQDILKSTTAILMFPWTHRGQVPQVQQENKKRRVGAGERWSEVVYVTAPSVQERSRESLHSRDLSRLQPYIFADFRMKKKIRIIILSLSLMAIICIAGSYVTRLWWAMLMERRSLRLTVLNINKVVVWMGLMSFQCQNANIKASVSYQYSWVLRKGEDVLGSIDLQRMKSERCLVFLL